MPAACALKGSYGIESTFLDSKIVWKSSEENNYIWVKGYNTDCFYLQWHIFSGCLAVHLTDISIHHMKLQLAMIFKI